LHLKNDKNYVQLYQDRIMNLSDLFAQENRTKRISQKYPLVALNELIDFKPLVDVVEAIAPRKQSEKGGRPAYLQKRCYTTDT
jgi:hypothetical protein